MTGKEKCRILKEIRREIAANNEIEWVVNECSHKGDCKGTCPHCESEVRKLEKELEIRRKLGKTVALVGIGAACVTSLVACRPGYFNHVVPGGIESPFGGNDLSGDVEILDGEIADPYPDDEPYPDDDLSGYVGG